MNFSDILVILIIGISILVGFYSGLILSIFRLLSFVLSYFIAISFYPIVSNILIHSPIYTWLSNIIKSSIISQPNIMQSKEMLINQQSTDSISTIISSIPIPNFLKEHLVSTLPQKVNSVLGLDSLITTLGNNLARFTIYAISIIILFVVVRICFSIARMLLKPITHLPVIKQMDKTAGALFGAIEGILIVLAMFAVCSLLTSIPAINDFICDVNNHSIFAKFLYQNNFFISLLPIA